MTETMRVDIARLRDCGPVFANLSLLVDETVRRLGDRLDAEGVCWGRDETGLAFHRSYAPAVAQAREALSALGAAVASIGDSLVEAADNVAASDDRSAYRFG
jgi:hypothetical protein